MTRPSYHSADTAVPDRTFPVRRSIRQTLIAALMLALWGMYAVMPDCQADDVPPAPTGTTPPVTLQDRLFQIEQSNQAMTRQLEELKTENESLATELNTLHSQLNQKIEDIGKTYTRRELEESQPGDIRTDEPNDDPKVSEKLKNPFEKALLWSSDDDEWTLQFHNEIQIDIRTYGQDHSDPVNQFGFYLPRMRMIFNGRLTKPIEYNVSINKGMGSLDLLDSYLNFNYDDRAQFRIGRFRVPFTYDFYALSNQYLATPERSVFALNMGLNRNTAVMLHGEILQEHADYALALTSGPRNSYFDTNSSKDFLAYLNVRPFHSSANWPILKHLNVGGSVDVGQQDQSALPIAFRTSASATTSAGTEESVPSFLAFRNNVTEHGNRAQWEAHLAYYYKQLTLQGAIDGGKNTYGFSNTPGQVEVDVKSWHMQFGYFLTGEEVTRRTFVDVLRPFDLRCGKRGPGALELQARFDHFQLGNNVFTGGLADPALWTNRVNTLDCGVNWYLNTYVKIDFDWQHCMYGNPVQYAPNKSSDSSDLYLVRFQSYF